MERSTFEGRSSDPQLFWIPRGNAAWRAFPRHGPSPSRQLSTFTPQLPGPPLQCPIDTLNFEP